MVMDDQSTLFRELPNLRLNGCRRVLYRYFHKGLADAGSSLILQAIHSEYAFHPVNPLD